MSLHKFLNPKTNKAFEVNENGKILLMQNLKKNGFEYLGPVAESENKSRPAMDDKTVSDFAEMRQEKENILKEKRELKKAVEEFQSEKESFENDKAAFEIGKEELIFNTENLKKDSDLHNELVQEFLKEKESFENLKKSKK